MTPTEFVPAPEFEQLPGEPARWFDRFVRYALLPPEHRSVLAVYRTEVDQAHNGTKRPAQVPGAWKAAIVTWRWKARAAEHDRRQHTQRLAELDQARAAMVERQLRLALAMQERAVAWLVDRENKLHTPRDVALFAKVAVELERVARGMPPAALLNLTALSDDALLDRYAELLEAIRES